MKNVIHSGPESALRQPPAASTDGLKRPPVAFEKVPRRDPGMGTRGEERTARLEAKVKELETFSYSVAHDLRAPLRGIAGFTEILVEEHGAQLDAEGRRMLGVIGRTAQRMDRLIDDFLGFARIGCRSLDASLIDMAELARGAFLQLAETAPGPVPLLDVGSLPPGWGDRSMVRQVFANLLGNAIKFTHGRPGSRIEVTGRATGDGNIYCVADNGVGFEQRHAQQLFGVFQRRHSDKDFEGTGVGLAVVQTIVQRHGGKAWAEGKINAGAKFYFTLPHHQENQHDHSI